MKIFTSDDFAKVHSTNIVDYALSQGFEIEKADREQKSYHIKHSGGTFLFPNGGYFCHSNNEKGNIIDFAISYQNLTFKEAMKNILASSGNYKLTYEIMSDKAQKIDANKLKLTTKKADNSTEHIKSEFIIPKQDTSIKKIVDYLTKNRMIDVDIVIDLIKNKNIYQAITIDTKTNNHYRNCAFVGYDNVGNIRYCSLRGLGDSTFRQDVLNSNKEYGFCIKGEVNPNKLYIYESPIDAISHMNLDKLENQPYKCTRLSCGGLNDKALKRYLAENKNIEEVYLCFDNDKPNDKGINVGQCFAEKCERDLKEQGYKAYIMKPINKDFNLDLVEYKKVMQLYNKDNKSKEYKDNTSIDINKNNKKSKGEFTI